MEKNKLIVVLLILAVVFSVLSIALNLSLSTDFEPVNDFQSKQEAEQNDSGNYGGNLNLVIEGGLKWTQIIF